MMSDPRAFPVPLPFKENGMSLRDWFASYAMMGVLANNAPLTDASGHMSLRTPDLMASISYQLADAMMKAREGVKPELDGGNSPVPGMPNAICHACGLGQKCAQKDCPN